jgi:1,4-dihydroxy-2-naphthoate polyprenyltransferase
LQIGCLSTVLIAVNNLRDAPEDATTGKRTLAVRMGQRFARWEITALAVLPFLLGAAWLHWQHSAAFFAPLVLTSVLWLRVVKQVWTQQGRALNSVLALSGAGLLLFSAALVWGLLR